ncbi:restriction endonuclease subunit S [Vibrio rumoiensis]|uniref:Type I restriction modification DNA specificity domain-containing protein n=1 Tax=Vibrio rumoiensis 1S-45 TaxID=1188252 RepID=A0A1E5DZ94_9VIBR|nr:restriction endonuclease subunit S [Vibrio rumoiensis]OEF23137.1 hypothetical protein A1QC_02715 [Vibrio rumoiensis 1S-45]
MSALPKGWKTVRLGDVTSKPQYGYTTKSSAVGNVRYLRTTDLTSGKVNWESVPYCVENPVIISKYQLKNNDIVISRAGSVGFHSLIKNPPANTVFASYLIRFEPNGNIEPKYLSHFLNSREYWEQITEKAAGVAVQNVNAKKLADLTLPLASKSQQKRIADKLDSVLAKVDAAQARLDKIPTLLKRFRQSVLAAATSGELTKEWREENGVAIECWQKIELKDVCRSISDGDHQAPPKVEKGIPFLVISNVSRGYINFGTVSRWVPQNYYDSLKSIRKPELGDILYTVTGSFGIPLIVNTCDNFCFQRHIAIIKPIDKVIEPYFLKLFLESPKIYKHASKIATGTAQKTVSLTNLRKFPITLPSKEEQVEISNKVIELFEHANTVEKQYQAAKARLDKLTQSILAKAFRGELVTADDCDIEQVVS